ncbi:pyrimidine/purine nucleoside phosphorylase [Lutibacter sp. HS1-25]|uniref:pyrimidine/purine nucleoside phosphorylase n=1 Tax=Lutibacter sp. HS1-25 TaxID=2485000 RepID=UPI0010138970|nr:pyrimidine/purine nucleoside phosphorylase [Lutibacter sp. HS1-25]RXP59475.1 pyrimidine/purine nucleoside phosphorylase [Lutibacter sp. HS1-25]
MISANEYFNATVKSLGYTSATGKSTVGVMEEGEYEFGTSTHETMIVIEGELIAQLPNETIWKSYKNGEKFEVEANTKFKVKSVGQTSYLCQYQ